MTNEEGQEYYYETMPMKLTPTRSEIYQAALEAASQRILLGKSYQDRVKDWMMACFGTEISSDKTERNHRFLEEALELVQSLGCTQHEAYQLVDYVYSRDQGEVNQEVGGVMVTLAALCLANGLDMASAGETELARIWTKVEKIRAKQASKPKHSPLPALPVPPEDDGNAGLRGAAEIAASRISPLVVPKDTGDNMVLVPRDPTEAMLEAANREWDGRMSTRSAGVWKAMIEAAGGKP